MDPYVARKTWRSLEAVHGMIYFTPDAAEAYAKLGVTNARMGYFASRSAAMGVVPTEVVIATFYNFHPGLVRKSMEGAWTITSPDAMIEARLSAADSSLCRAFGDAVLRSDELAAAAKLIRETALAACARPQGRPLFAAHAALSWPDEAHLVLWHGQTLLREFRGDGHIAALTMEGLTGLEALISHAASGDVPADVLRMSRRWSEEEWLAGIEGLAARGIVNADGSFTDAGREQRQRIEEATDRLAFGPYASMTDVAAATLRDVGKKLTGLVVAAGLLTPDHRLLRDPD